MKIFDVQKVSGDPSQDGNTKKEILRAINSGKARVFLFRTINMQMTQMGSLIPQFNTQDGDEDTQVED